MRLNPQTQDPMQSSGTATPVLLQCTKGTFCRECPWSNMVAKALVNGPASWEQTLGRAAKGKNPKPAQVVQRTSISEKGGVGGSLPGCIRCSLTPLSNLKRFFC